MATTDDLKKFIERYMQIENELTCLKEDKRCLGGAVAVPFKEKIFSLIKDSVKEEIKVIGAINCFYRSASDPV